MRVLVIANCQGAPLARLLELWFEDVSSQVIAVHQIGEKKREQAELLLAQGYDAVLTQPISDTYPVEFVRTTRLAEAFKGKTVTWSNAYFRGYNPELQYYRLGAKHTIGPLGDYHVTTIIEAFKKGESVERAAGLLADEEYNRVRYEGVEGKSLAELMERERSLDVSIGSFIEEHFAKQRLFYSFNHPSNRVLFEIARNLAKKIGLRQKFPFQNGLVGEFLSHIRPPVNPCLTGRFSEASARRVYAGIGDVDGIYPSGRNSTKLYSDISLVQAFYALYERQPEFQSAAHQAA